MCLFVGWFICLFICLCFRLRMFARTCAFVCTSEAERMEAFQVR